MNVTGLWSFVTSGVEQLLKRLGEVLAGLVGKALGMFGLSVVTFNGILPQLKSFVLSMTGSLPAAYMEFLGAIGIGIAFSMIFSALTIRMAWKIFIVPTAAVSALEN